MVRFPIQFCLGTFERSSRIQSYGLRNLVVFSSNCHLSAFLDIDPTIFSPFFNIHKENDNTCTSTKQEQKWKAHPGVIGGINDSLHNIRPNDTGLWTLETTRYLQIRTTYSSVCNAEKTKEHVFIPSGGYFRHHGLRIRVVWSLEQAENDVVDPKVSNMVIAYHISPEANHAIEWNENTE